MEKFISVIIPNYNMAATIGTCLEAAFSSAYKNFEVVVVDDCSEDNSVEIIKRFPCRLIRMDERGGTSRARNTGALNSRGEILFFIDADCLLEKETLSAVNEGCLREGPGVVTGGTYTRIPYDDRFCSIFQSVFVNYFETRMAGNADYIAAHAMVMDAVTFRESGGFPEEFLPIIEDVEYGHRLKRQGYRLVINPAIQVRHIFDFSLMKSLRNAFRKTTYWCVYSLTNKDLFSDSGCASADLKTNVALNFCLLAVLSLYAASGAPRLLLLLPVFFAVNTFLHRGLLGAFYETKGALFAAGAFFYYSVVYPLPIGLGTIWGTVKYLVGEGDVIRQGDAKVREDEAV